HFDTRTEVIVSAGDNVEIRKISLTNRGMEPAKLEVTSYFEPVIDTYDADLAHPAFSKLFVTTEFDSEKNLLLATRRSRTENQKKFYIVHGAFVQGRLSEGIRYETDRN